MSSAERRTTRGTKWRPPGRPAGRQTFPKQRRLRKRREFLAVQGEGHATHGRYLLVVSRPAGPGPEGSDTELRGRVGITVSKKVGSAVKRNRIKRLIREYVRRHDFAVCKDVVVIAKRSAAGLRSYRGVERDLQRIGGELA